MTTETKRETRGFQTEVKQLLHLMVHSLYSNREIFLRELVSNASDACDKLRFESLNNAELLEDSPDPQIRIAVDKDARTVTISDNGIGMSRDEVINNLGTIAKSGTSEFLQQLSGDQKKDSQLIGQFGVGFYSAFIVADKVSVRTRRAGLPAEEGVFWESEGEGEYQLDSIEQPARGTEITLHIRADADEFLDDFRIRSVLTKYSDHIGFPIVMKKEVEVETEGDAEGEEDKPKETQLVDETVNSATALWTLPRNEIKDDEYKSFYKHVAHDYEDPMTWAHNRIEGKLEYVSLLYVPGHAPFDLWNREQPRGLKLYVNRVFIMDQADNFLPLYLRFIKGVVDSSDLSLNVSRELLQDDETVQKMRSALTKQALKMLNKLAADKPEEYGKFWKEFGSVLKEGPAEDFSNKEEIAKLFRFASTHSGKADELVSVEDYVSRMKEGQKKIYYVTGENYTNAANSPHLEVFRKKGIEVLLLTDRIDEWMMSSLHSFDGKDFQDVSRGKLDLGDLDTEEDKKAREEANEQHKDFLERVKGVLEARVEEVRMTDRLTDSPACVVVGEYDMGAQMRKIMEAAGQKVPESKPSLELNPQHPLVQKLDQEADEDRFGELAQLLLDQAVLAEGEQLPDASAFVHRLNKLLLELSS